MESIVTSKDNPAIRLYRRLSSYKKDRQRYGLFVLEGERIVREAVEAGAVKDLFITQDAAESFGIDGSENFGVRLISDLVAQHISQTETPQGVFAVCRMEQKPPVFRDGGRYIVLYGLQDTGNMGTIIRTADALGIDGVLLCRSCDLYNPKTLRSTMGAIFRCRIGILPDEEELFSLLEKNGVHTAAAVVSKDAVSLTRLGSHPRQAVFIGNEGNGLPAEISQRCAARLTIPMRGCANSLNAAMAAGIIMWELERQV